MATISDRSDATLPLNDGDHFLVRQPSESGTKTRKISKANLAAEMGGGGGAFTDLTDVPASYSGQADKVVTVKGTEDGLQFTSPTAVGTTVYSGKATLASGTVTVAAAWVGAGSRVVVTACAAPSTPGTNLYVDPANFVASTSFDISSDDATDARSVFWFGIPGLAGFGSEFWIQFDVSFAADEIAIATFGSNLIDLFTRSGGDDGAGSIFAVAPSFGTNEIQFFTNEEETDVSVTFTPDTPITIKLHCQIVGNVLTVTPNVDGTDFTACRQALVFDDADPTPNQMRSFDFGGRYPGSVTKRRLDNLIIGTTDGGNDLFSADFASTIVPPFDSVAGAGSAVVDTGTMYINETGDDAYALKDVTSEGDAGVVVEVLTPGPADAYALLDLGSDHDHVFVSCELYIPAASLTAWTGGGGSGFFITFLDSSDNPLSGIGTNNAGSMFEDQFGAGGAGTTPVANTWLPIRAYYQASNETHDFWTPVNTLAYNTVGGSATNQIRKILVGQFTATQDSTVYMRNFRIGTTSFGHDLLLDLQGADLSAWTSTTGSISVIPNPV